MRSCSDSSSGSIAGRPGVFFSLSTTAFSCSVTDLVDISTGVGAGPASSRARAAAFSASISQGTEATALYLTQVSTGLFPGHHRNRQGDRRDGTVRGEEPTLCACDYSGSSPYRLPAVCASSLLCAFNTESILAFASSFRMYFARRAAPLSGK